MKVWWVLAWDTYYPDGALFNVDSTWENEESADAAAAELRGNRDHVCVVDVSDMLGVDK